MSKRMKNVVNQSQRSHTVSQRSEASTSQGGRIRSEPPTSQRGGKRSEPSTSQSGGIASKPNDEIDKMVGSLVYYMLVADQQKFPIKKSEILKNVLKDEKSQFFNQVFDTAVKKLKKVYGLEVVEADKKGSYMIINSIHFESDNNQEPLAIWSKSEQREMALLYCILSMIFMNNNRVSENTFWQLLKKLGVELSPQPHSVFGDVKKLITRDFVRQQYLVFEKVPNSDPPASDVTWGLRAHREFPKVAVLGLASSVLGTQPTDWPEQLKQATSEDETMDS